MRNGGWVTVDADELLKRIDKVRRSLDELSRFLARGMTTEPPAQTRKRKAELSKGQRYELTGFDISRLEWKTQGGDPAGTNASWCWTFSTDREGFTLDEALPLVEAIERYGPEVVVGDYILTLSGRDGNLLSRRKAKK